jgi:hypothetical protein
MTKRKYQKASSSRIQPEDIRMFVGTSRLDFLVFAVEQVAKRMLEQAGQAQGCCREVTELFAQLSAFLRSFL